MKIEPTGQGCYPNRNSPIPGDSETAPDAFPVLGGVSAARTKKQSSDSPGHLSGCLLRTEGAV
jgi:hypothetical protein